MSLDLDQKQELTNAARKIAQMAEVQWEALAATSIPLSLAEQMMLVWWRNTFAPEMPDFSKLFEQGD